MSEGVRPKPPFDGGHSGAKDYGAVTDASRVGELLRAIDGYGGRGFTKMAMQLAPHVFVRPGELRHAEWSEIDLDAALWTIPADKTKMRKDHRVPLSRQAVALLREVQAFTGPSGYQLIADGRLEARKVGKRTLIPAASLRALIAGED